MGKFFAPRKHGTINELRGQLEGVGGGEGGVGGRRVGDEGGAAEGRRRGGLGFDGEDGGWAWDDRGVGEGEAGEEVDDGADVG